MIPDLAAKFVVWGLVLGYGAVTALGLDIWRRK